MSKDHPDAFENQDIIHLLTVDELRDLSNLKEMRRSLAAITRYFEEREGAIFQAARSRQGGESNVQVD